MNSNKITNLANGSNPNDAVNFSQLSGLGGTNPLNVISTTYVNTGDTNFNGYNIINTAGVYSNAAKN